MNPHIYGGEPASPEWVCCACGARYYGRNAAVACHPLAEVCEDPQGDL